MLVITAKSAYAVRALAELARRGGSPVPIGEVAARRDMSPQFLESLFVTLRTVELHLSNAYNKLQIRSRHELAAALEP